MAEAAQSTFTEDREQVAAEELAAIRAARPGAGAEDLAGLALSGGGIRSASFSLGVMQALARHGWMQRFDYLSTVSGGGYIGASLGWLLSRAAAAGHPADDFGTTAAAFPFGTRRPGRRRADRPAAMQPGAEPVKAARVTHIRQHGNYLAPDREVTLWSLLACVLRGLVVSLAVYLPLLLALFALLRLAGVYQPLYGATPHQALLVMLWPEGPAEAWLRLGLTRMADLALIAVLAAILVSLLYAAVSRLLRSGGAEAGGGFSFRAFDGRRWFDSFGGRYLAMVMTPALVLASLPLVDAVLHAGAGMAGLLASLGGGGAALAVFRSWKYLPRALLAPLAAVALVYGVLLLAFALTRPSVPQGWPWWWPLPLAALGALLGRATISNYVSVHRYYRDRLMEAFMPPAGADVQGPGSADGFALRHMLDSAADGSPVARRPYHLVNTNAVLVDSRQTLFRLRGGDAFVLSALWCGSAATGWRRTEEFIGGRLTLPTAMAVSGAAVNPNTGAGGEGVTRNRALSWLLVLLNLRLGFWAPNPRHPAPGVANLLRPGLDALLLHQDEQSGWLELSDGGHFENLGVYELLRRRCRLIVCCEGAADPGYRFADLANLMVRARADLGVRIELDDADLAALRPDPPSGVAARAFAVARIRYDVEDRDGLLVLVTTTYVAGLSADLASYRARHPSFPDQPTSDQFFDEQQFEAYRELGYSLGSRMRDELREVMAARGMDAEAELGALGLGLACAGAAPVSGG